MITTNESQATLTPLLTVREAADVLRVSERTLWTLTHSGELPAVRVGRSVRYDQSDITSWIESRKTA
jgi:excisionase family DNA binding protein